MIEIGNKMLDILHLQTAQLQLATQRRYSPFQYLSALMHLAKTICNESFCLRIQLILNIENLKLM